MAEAYEHECVLSTNSSSGGSRNQIVKYEPGWPAREMMIMMYTEDNEDDLK